MECLLEMLMFRKEAAAPAPAVFMHVSHVSQPSPSTAVNTSRTVYSSVYNVVFVYIPGYIPLCTEVITAVNTETIRKISGQSLVYISEHNLRLLLCADAGQGALVYWLLVFKTGGLV